MDDVSKARIGRTFERKQKKKKKMCVCGKKKEKRKNKFKLKIPTLTNKMKTTKITNGE